MSETKSQRDLPIRVADDRTVTYTPNNHAPHTGTFAFKKKWSAHVVAEALNNDSSVQFAEYNKDAIADPGGKLLIQTNGQKSPAQALIDALGQTISDLDVIGKKVLEKAQSSTPSPIASYAPLSKA
jgi:DNA-directed RNA polymerase subunit L